MGGVSTWPLPRRCEAAAADAGCASSVRAGAGLGMPRMIRRGDRGVIRSSLLEYKDCLNGTIQLTVPKRCPQTIHDNIVLPTSSLKLCPWRSEQLLALRNHCGRSIMGTESGLGSGCKSRWDSPLAGCAYLTKDASSGYGIGERSEPRFLILGHFLVPTGWRCSQQLHSPGNVTFLLLSTGERTTTFRTVT